MAPGPTEAVVQISEIWTTASSWLPVKVRRFNMGASDQSGMDGSSADRGCGLDLRDLDHSLQLVASQSGMDGSWADRGCGLDLRDLDHSPLPVMLRLYTS